MRDAALKSGPVTRAAEYALVGLMVAMNLIAEACDPRNAERMRWAMRVAAGVAVGFVSALVLVAGVKGCGNG
jgi:hypothetical protein